MMSNKKTIGAPRGGSVVGTIHSAGSLKAALKLEEGAVDYLELRVDSFLSEESGGKEIASLLRKVEKLHFPLIVTVRDPKEGGVNPLSWKQRVVLYHKFLEKATLIDVELRNSRQAADLINEAKQQGVGVILSHHDFKAIPSLKRLKELSLKAQHAGGTLFKVAVMARQPRALATLLQWVAEHKSPEFPLAAMGMGEFGKVSRLALGGTGSVLNYGYLDRVQVPGQWPAEVLKNRLSELSGMD